MKSKILTILFLVICLIISILTNKNLRASQTGGTGTETEELIKFRQFRHCEDRNDISRMIQENLNSGENAAATFTAKNDDERRFSFGISSSGWTQKGVVKANSCNVACFSEAELNIGSVYNQPIVFGNCPDDLGITTCTEEAMRISSDGVGIGTSTPAYELDVYGSIRGVDYYSGDGSQGFTGTINNVVDVGTNGLQDSIRIYMKGLIFKDGLFIGETATTTKDVDVDT